jgi:hypothetical protein
MRPDGAVRLGRRAGWAIVGGVWLLAAVRGFCAETVDPSATATTVMILKLDSTKPVDIRTWFQERPPTITIEFSRQRVIGSLPERSTIQEGIIRTILTQYYSGRGLQPSRFIRSLQIILSAPYAYRVRSEPGRIVVAIDHPTSVGSSTMEIGLKGGTILGSLGQRRVSERFRAMQDALEHAAPSRAALPIPSEPRGLFGPERSRTAIEPETRGTPTAVSAHSTASSRPTQSTQQSSNPMWWGLALMVVAAAAGLWVWSHPEVFRTALRREPPPLASGRLPSGVALIDELIWQAFERQGYQLIKAVEGGQPSGLLRIITKDGSKTALLFVWNGSFFEKRTVEQFASAMRDVGVDQGFLVASGSFTVPAQRVAKDRGITLLGREQLMELLSAGATSEYFTKQVEQLHARVEESKETLQQYANQLDTLRRQRNEASWYLGEERVKSGQLEAQLADAGQQLRQHESELTQWMEEAATLRKQWEESLWYLGESRARIRHLEANLSELQEAAKRLETAERERDEANWYLGETRQRLKEFEQQLASAQQQLAASCERERTLQSARDHLRRALGALQAYGERRRVARVRIPDAHVELLDGDGDHQPIFAGSPRDLSESGMGLETDREMPDEALRVRLSLPGAREPIESKARVIWQQQAEVQPLRYHSGCQLLGLPETIRARIAEVVEQAQT